MVARTSSLAGLEPLEFTAPTWNEYVVPFVRPVTVAVSAVETPSSNVVHVLVPSAENSTT